jgi:hypothetical protein
MTRTYVALWLLLATAVAVGVLVGSLLATAIAPDARAASRAAPESIPAVSRPVAGSVALDDLAQRGQPDSHPGSPTASPVPGGITPSPAVTGSSPEPTRKPRTATILRGIATWFNSPAGVSAAGPDLRAALGPGWRGTRVRVCAERCVTTVLGDFMRADRLIDLHAPLFARLAPLSRGVLRVSLSW